MKLGLFYQSSKRYVSAFYVIEQFRKFYSTEPIALYEDNSDVLKPVADYFNCEYKRISNTYENYENRPFQSRGVSVDLNSTLIWFDRLYEACTTTLKDVDWIMHMEDDVWFVRQFENEPPYDLNSIAGRGWYEELYKHLGTNVRGSYGCGGAVFNRLKFIESYHKLKEVDWELVDSMAVDPKPTEWADIALTFAFLNNKSSVGSWGEIVNYKSFNEHSYSIREAFTEESLNDKQGDVAVVHTWKLYYFPTEEEINYVNNKLNERNN